MRHSEVSAEHSDMFTSDSQNLNSDHTLSEHAVWHKTAFNKWFVFTQFLWTVVESENTKGVFSCLKDWVVPVVSTCAHNYPIS